MIVSTLHSDTGFNFGEFRLDARSGQLYRNDAPVPLTPKAFSVLQYLAGRPGSLVPKQELLDAVWPGVFVGDAVLKVAVREIRKALGDSTEQPRFIETAHRRGYRFIAAATSPIVAAPIAPPRTILGTPTVTKPSPRVQYAHSGSVNIAFEVVGSGAIDLVFVMGWVSHLEYFWNEPHFARFLNRLASFGRLITFDKRGTGLSDPVPVSQLPSLEQRMDDVRAVMEAAGSRRAVLVGVSEGAPLCTLFAATYPEKTEALVAIGSYARRMRDADYPWGRTPEQLDAFCHEILDQWGGPVGLEERAPSMADDEAFREWWASYLRMGASPGAAVALTRMNAEIDVRDVLPSIKVPTLVLHRAGDRCLKIEEGRFLASRIPSARFVELPGDDHLPFVGRQDDIVDEIERFVGNLPSRPTGEQVLATVLTVWSEAPAVDREHLRRVFDREVAAWRGRTFEVGDRRLAAAFDGPGRAVRCGCAVTTVASRSHIALRVGVHIGEWDPASPGGPLSDMSAHIAKAASPGEVLVSRTVVDLVPGSGLQFVDRGGLRATGVGRELPILAVAR
jgi:pimeloyl-ACP methyl ester carboxylesterase